MWTKSKTYKYKKKKLQELNIYLNLKINITILITTNSSQCLSSFLKNVYNLLKYYSIEIFNSERILVMIYSIWFVIQEKK